MITWIILLLTLCSAQAADFVRDSTTTMSSRFWDTTNDAVVSILKRRKHPTTLERVCEGLTDKDYPLSFCDQRYISCVNGFATIHTCYGELIFSSYTYKCEYRGNNPYCGTTTPTQLIRNPDFCLGKDDGMHGNGCSQFFFFCYDGQGVKFPCSQGLYYDSQKKECNVKELIADCGWTDDYCQGKEDGFHGEGCNSAFYSCTKGIAHKMNCPESVYFDPKEKRCNYGAKIKACEEEWAPRLNEFGIYGPPISPFERLEEFRKSNGVIKRATPRIGLRDESRDP